MFPTNNFNSNENVPLSTFSNDFANTCKFDVQTDATIPKNEIANTDQSHGLSYNGPVYNNDWGRTTINPVLNWDVPSQYQGFDENANNGTNLWSTNNTAQLNGILPNDKISYSYWNRLWSTPDISQPNTTNMPTSNVHAQNYNVTEGSLENSDVGVIGDRKLLGFNSPNIKDDNGLSKNDKLQTQKKPSPDLLNKHNDVALELINLNRQYFKLVENGVNKEIIETVLRCPNVNYMYIIRLFKEFNGRTNQPIYAATAGSTYDSKMYPAEFCTKSSQPMKNNQNLSINIGNVYCQSSSSTDVMQSNKIQTDIQNNNSNVPNNVPAVPYNTVDHNVAKSSTDQNIAILTQIKMAVQCGFLKPDILHKKITPGTWDLIYKLLSCIKMANIEKQHEIVKSSLFQFVNKHIADADLSVVDEIVLSYVISILEEASEDPCFDVDGFVEMMSAYFPDFSRINPAEVCTWIFQLENQLSSLNKSSQAHNLSLKSLCLSDIIPESKLRARPPSVSESVETSSSNNAKRTQHLSETSDGGSTDSSGCEFFSDECDALTEMFPESSFMEIKHCVTIANGDIDRATQILLDRQETGQSLSTNLTNIHAPKNQVIDDNELKNRIISRYSYVDKNAETKEYKPVIPKIEPKKLVRYRDNKIVSLKGERYTDVRRDEEAELKKPKKPICP